MPNVQIRAQLSFDELLQVVNQLNRSELEQFVFQVIALQAQRRAPSLPKDETQLLLKINQKIPSDIQNRYNKLISKRQAEKLMPNEQSELLLLTDQVEKTEVKRMKYMSKLACLRKTSLSALMKELHIQLPVYA